MTSAFERGALLFADRDKDIASRPVFGPVQLNALSREPNSPRVSLELARMHYSWWMAQCMPSKQGCHLDTEESFQAFALWIHVNHIAAKSSTCKQSGRCAVYGLFNFRVLRRSRLIYRLRHNMCIMNTHIHLFTYVRSVPENPRVMPVRRGTHSVTIRVGPPKNRSSRQFVDSSRPNNNATIGEEITSLSTAALFLGYGKNANFLGHQTSMFCTRNSNYRKCHFTVFYTPHGSKAWW
jgi:hypothetical protein